MSQAITRPPAATPDDGEVTITAAGSVLPVLNVGHGVGSSEMLPGGF